MAPKPCPFTDARLYELYWREGKSLVAIRGLASEIMGETVGQTALTRWLREAGYALRSRKEASAVRVAKAPEVYQTRAKQMGDAWQTKYEAGEVSPPINRVVSAKCRRAAIKATKGRKMETRTCALAGCTNTITRPVHQFRCKNAYCCRQHMGFAVNQQRKDDKEYQAWLDTLEQNQNNPSDQKE